MTDKNLHDRLHLLCFRESTKHIQTVKNKRSRVSSLPIKAQTSLFSHVEDLCRHHPMFQKEYQLDIVLDHFYVEFAQAGKIIDKEHLRGLKDLLPSYRATHSEADRLGYFRQYCIYQTPDWVKDLSYAGEIRVSHLLPALVRYADIYINARSKWVLHKSGAQLQSLFLYRSSLLHSNSYVLNTGEVAYFALRDLHQFRYADQDTALILSGEWTEQEEESISNLLGTRSPFLHRVESLSPSDIPLEAMMLCV